MLLTALALAMLLTLASFSLLTGPASVNPVHAYSSGPGTWLITANYSNSTISLVNTADNTVYGPFLEGQLGPINNLLDVAVTPDGRTALVSNFAEETVYFVDISTPLSPSVIVSVTVPMYAEDIAITHDGQFALVTDGGYRSLVASISLVSRTLVYSLDVSPLAAQAVETAPDGTIIIAANYSDQQIGTLAIDDAGRLTSVMSYTIASGRPLNLGVALMVKPCWSAILILATYMFIGSPAPATCFIE
jgi:DNA-binding beta-propeller fold protein YncE